MLGLLDMGEHFNKVQDMRIAELAGGVTYEIDSVENLIQGEKLVVNACRKFKAHLHAMESFGGQEVIEL